MIHRVEWLLLAEDREVLQVKYSQGRVTQYESHCCASIRTLTQPGCMLLLWVLLPACAEGKGEACFFSQFTFLTQLTVTGTPYCQHRERVGSLLWVMVLIYSTVHFFVSLIFLLSIQFGCCCLEGAMLDGSY